MIAIRSVVLGLALSCCIQLAQAEDAAPAFPQLEAACQQNPDKCAELRAQAQAKCAEDPTACAARKEKLAERAAKLKEKCDANPEQCAERKAKMQQRAEAFKAKCAADPAACEQKKAAMRERMQKRQERRQSAGQ
jgi:Skp family chaperone for outer membrane proteins